MTSPSVLATVCACADWLQAGRVGRLETNCYRQERIHGVAVLGEDGQAALLAVWRRIVLISLSDGRTEGLPVGAYLASYDPEGRRQRRRRLDT
jgi:hypothetical protein